MHYSKQINTLRFFAVFMVLMDHFAHHIGLFFSAGYFGVDLFFVISGFLITKILLNIKADFISAYKNFMARRFLRIVPLYFFTIAILAILGYTYVNEYMIYCFSFTFNYAMVYFGLPNNAITHFWSLCVEEQFYLLWPLFVLPLRGRRTLLLVIVLILVSLCYLQFYFTLIKPLVNYRWVGLIPQAYAIGIGAAGAIACKEKWKHTLLLKSKIIEWVCCILLIYFLHTNHAIKYFLVPFLSLFWVLKCYYNAFAQKYLSSIFNNKYLIYLGTISYGIYLFHLPLGYYLDLYLFQPFLTSTIHTTDKLQSEISGNQEWLYKFPIMTLLTVFLASISHRYVEMPILKLKDKYFRYDNNMNES